MRCGFCQEIILDNRYEVLFQGQVIQCNNCYDHYTDYEERPYTDDDLNMDLR